MEELFYQLVKKLFALGEIRYEHLFVDGTKIEANANKYNFVWKKSTTKYEIQLDGKLEKLIPEMCSKYGILADTPEDEGGFLSRAVVFCSLFFHKKGYFCGFTPRLYA